MTRCCNSINYIYTGSRYPLQHFEPIYLSFHLPVAPWFAYCRFHCAPGLRLSSCVALLQFGVQTRRWNISDLAGTPG